MLKRLVLVRIGLIAIEMNTSRFLPLVGHIAPVTC